VGRAVVDAQRRRATADIDAQRFPGKRLLEDPLADVACEEERVRTPRTERREETQLSDTYVLALIDDSIVKCGVHNVRKLGCELREEPVVREQPRVCNSR